MKLYDWKVWDHLEISEQFFPNKDSLLSRPLKSYEWKPNLKWQDDWMLHHHRCHSNTLQHQHIGCPKKCTIRMLLDPPCTGSVTSSRLPCVQKSIFWPVLTKTKQDWALPSHVHGKIWPHSAQFWLWFFLLVLFLGHPVVLISSGNIGSILKPSGRFWTHPEIDWKRSKVFETFKKYRDSFVIRTVMQGSLIFSYKNHVFSKTQYSEFEFFLRMQM